VKPIEIILSEVEPYQSGARFFAAIGYPDDVEQRQLYFQAIVRYAIDRWMDLDEHWASGLRRIRPVYFSGSDKQQQSILRRGNKRVHERLAAAQFFLLPHLRAIDTGRSQKVESYEPTVGNMAILTMNFLGMQGDSQATVKHRIWKPTKLVAHAMCAYVVWHQILWEKWGRNPKADKKLAFLLLPEMVQEVVEVSEVFRSQLAQIQQFKIREQETIRFTTLRLPYVAAAVIGEEAENLPIGSQVVVRPDSWLDDVERFSWT
jgi:hypothetical protein